MLVPRNEQEIVAVLKIVVIAREFGVLEHSLLAKNCARAREFFEYITLAYVLERVDNARTCLETDPSVHVYQVENSSNERNAALSRAIGFDAIQANKQDIIIFLDGDMLITRSFFHFIREITSPSFIALSNRVDIWNISGRMKRRKLCFTLDKSGSFKKLYGCLAMRGIDFARHNVMTHDMEEQWLLRSLENITAEHIAFPLRGVLHFDRFVGIDRKIRFLSGSRGVGFWQELFRNRSVTGVWSFLNFVFRQKKSSLDLFKFMAASICSLPKVLIYRMPKQLFYHEIFMEPLNKE